LKIASKEHDPRAQIRPEDDNYDISTNNMSYCCCCCNIMHVSTAMPLRREGEAAKELELRRGKNTQKTGAERVQGSNTKALTS